MYEEEGDKATGEDDDDPAVEDGDVLHDGEVSQGEVGSIRGDASKVCQVVHLNTAIMNFAVKNILKGGYRNFSSLSLVSLGMIIYGGKIVETACSDLKINQNYKISQNARGILVNQLKMYLSHTDLVGEDVSKAIVVQGKEGWYG